MTGPSVLLWTRERESFVKVHNSDPGNCTVCGQPLISAWFIRDDWKPVTDHPWDTGTYTSLRHADGSPNHGDMSPMTKNRCPECRGEDLSYEDTGYGWIARCPCGWHKYSDSGD